MSFKVIIPSLFFMPLLVHPAQATQFCDQTGCRPMAMEQHRQVVSVPVPHHNAQNYNPQNGFAIEAANARSLRATPVRTPSGHLHMARPNFVQHNTQATISSSIRLHLE